MHEGIVSTDEHPYEWEKLLKHSPQLPAIGFPEDKEGLVEYEKKYIQTKAGRTNGVDFYAVDQFDWVAVPINGIVEYFEKWIPSSGWVYVKKVDKWFFNPEKNGLAAGMSTKEMYKIFQSKTAIPVPDKQESEEVRWVMTPKEEHPDKDGWYYTKWTQVPDLIGMEFKEGKWQHKYADTYIFTHWFKEITTPSTKETGQREAIAFNLSEAIEIWLESGHYHSPDGFMKGSPDYIQFFKKRFGVDVLSSAPQPKTYYLTVDDLVKLWEAAETRGDHNCEFGGNSVLPNKFEYLQSKFGIQPSDIK